MADTCPLRRSALDAGRVRARAAQVIGAVERWAAMGTPPVMASLGVRTRAAAEELTERLGADRYRQLHAQGGGMPVIDVIHRTRAVLLGQESRD